MLLLCAVFALLTVGFVIPCVIDIAMTPGSHFDVPSKQTWLIVAVAFWAFGSATWLLVGRRDVRMRAACDEVSDGLMFGDEGGLWSSPSRRTGLRDRSGIRRRERYQMTAASRFVAPDDNPDFLLELDRRIRGGREDA
jgi:hypothetical protein